jgi:ribonuclease VapC
LVRENDVLISAVTLAEVLIVLERRNLVEPVSMLIDQLGLQEVPVTAASARRAARVYARFGKGIHPAGLNFSDCFAYELAIFHSCPLLFVGADFSKTDVTSALERSDTQ